MSGVGWSAAGEMRRLGEAVGAVQEALAAARARRRAAPGRTLAGGPGATHAPANATAAGLAAADSAEPRVALILGTGLGGLAERIDADVALDYEDIPYYPTAGVATHRGRLVVGRLEGVPVVAMQGRFHGYEGRSMREIAFPVRVMRLLGARTLVVSAACGGMNPLWGPGDIVVLDDHVNFMGDSPLIGPNLDELGPRFPDMSAPYDAGLARAAAEVAMAEGLVLRRGVYVAVPGPQLETRAEYRMLRAMGADVVGMSTVPEVIAARHMDMRVLALAVITDQCLPDALEAVDVERIIATAVAAEPKLTSIVCGVLRRAAADDAATEPAGAGTEPAESGTEPAESGTEPAESGTEPAESGTEPAESPA